MTAASPADLSHEYFCSGMQEVVLKAADIQNAISEGSNSFLFTEYKYMGVFMVRGPRPARPISVPGAGPSQAVWPLSPLPPSAAPTPVPHPLAIGRSSWPC